MADKPGPGGMHFGPLIVQARPLRRYSAGPYEATLLDNIVSGGRVQYLYALEVTRAGTPCLYVTSEGSAHGFWFLGVFSTVAGEEVAGEGTGEEGVVSTIADTEARRTTETHYNYGLSDDWEDIDLFEARALELVQEYLNEKLAREED